MSTKFKVRQWAWCVICAVLSALFFSGWVYFVEEAMRMWLHPPEWRLHLLATPEYRYLVRWDVPLLLMMSCAPLGFFIIWVTRLVMAIRQRA
jgi:hypothetical protein